MLTVLEIIRKTTEYFAARSVESPRLNAELLVGHALGKKRMQLYLEFERPLAETELEKIRPLVRRRAQHEPLQYILGETEFAGVKLRVDRRALIPRPETELLVELVTARWGADRSGRLLDLGTGSGAIALALASSRPGLQITATDASDAALELARENAVNLGLTEKVTFARADWYEGLDGPAFDVVVSNPPYLTADETAATAPEVRDFEPAGALTAADGGVADLARIIAGAPARLAPGGFLALETGPGQHERLISLARQAGFSRVESRRDLTGRDRFVLADL
jgi:release factor glutamine methyltransferase